MVDMKMCPKFESAFDVLGKRWTGLIIRALLSGCHRFGDMSEMIPQMSDRMLTERLKELETSEIVKRTVYPETPVRIEYELTEKGKDLSTVMDQVQAWVILRLLYPNGTVPIISMSVNPRLSPGEQYDIGKALAPLRDEDILIIGSGGTVHNLGAVNFSAGPGEIDSWALAFDQWLDSELTTWNLDSLFNYREKAPHVDYAVPHYGPEHFVPIFYARGASYNSTKSKLLFRQYEYGNLSHSVWQFG